MVISPFVAMELVDAAPVEVEPALLVEVVVATMLLDVVVSVAPHAVTKRTTATRSTTSVGRSFFIVVSLRGPDGRGVAATNW
jgi:hypothetical protein